MIEKRNLFDKSKRLYNRDLKTRPKPENSFAFSPFLFTLSFLSFPPLSSPSPSLPSSSFLLLFLFSLLPYGQTITGHLRRTARPGEEDPGQANPGVRGTQACDPRHGQARLASADLAQASQPESLLFQLVRELSSLRRPLFVGGFFIRVHQLVVAVDIFALELSKIDSEVCSFRNVLSKF